MLNDAQQASNCPTLQTSQKVRYKLLWRTFLLSVGSSKADRRPRTAPPKKGEPPRGDPPPIPRKCGVCYAGYCLSTARPEGLPIFSYTFGNEQVMRIVDNRQHAEWELTHYAKVATQAQLSSKFVEIFL